MNSRVFTWFRLIVLAIVIACTGAGIAIAQQGGNGYSGTKPFVLDASAITLAGNVTGPATNNTVVEIQNVNVSATPPTSGQFFVASDAGGWTPITLSGQLSCSTTNPGSCSVITDAGIGTLGGNVVGPAGSNTVIDIQNVPVSDSGVTAGQFMIVNDAGTWMGTSVSGLTCSATNPGFCYLDGGSFTLAGDTTGPANNNTVTKFRNIAMAPGAVLADQIMGVTDAGTWAPLNVMADLSNSAVNPGAFTVTSISGPAPVNVTNSTLSFGTTPATAGNIRLPTAEIIEARNNANSANLTLLQTNSSDQIVIGDGTNTSGQIYNIASAGNYIWMVGGAQFMATVGSASAGTLRPNTDDGVTLGTNTQAWSSVYTWLIRGSGSANGALAFAPTTVGLTSGASNVLTAAQYGFPHIRFTGTLTGGGTTVTFPAVDGACWWLDFSAIVTIADSIGLIANGNTWSVAVAGVGTEYPQICYTAGSGRLIGTSMIQ